MGMKLFLDDIRPAPPGWIPVRNAEDFRSVMLAYDWDEVSFDHDLGIDSTLGRPTQEVTGYDLVQWMFAMGRQPRLKPRVHSANPAGAARIWAYINEHWKATA